MVKMKSKKKDLTCKDCIHCTLDKRTTGKTYYCGVDNSKIINPDDNYCDEDFVLND